MVIARSTKENIPYVLEAERDLPPEQQSTFLLASLSNDMMMSLLQLMQEGQTKKWVEVTLTAGLRGWRNFLGEDGNEAPFRRDPNLTRGVHGVEIKGPVAKATLELLPTEHLFELAQAVMRANKLSPDDAKN